MLHKWEVKNQNRGGVSVLLSLSTAKQVWGGRGWLNKGWLEGLSSKPLGDKIFTNGPAVYGEMIKSLLQNEESLTDQCILYI